MATSKHPPAETASPIADLQQILTDAGGDIAKLFGPALSTFAGALADTKTAKEKYSDLERLIMGNEK
jgi:hypothetical protein